MVSPTRPEQRTCHLKLHIFDLLPSELINDNKQYHNKLVYEYINECIDYFKMNDKYPEHLSNIILMYCPVFCH